MFKHILLPIDGSELSLMATRRAAEFASEIKASITLLFVKPEYPVSYYGDGALIDYLGRELPDAATHRVYLDRGTLTLDATLGEYQTRAEAAFRAKGYAAPRLQTRLFEGADHTERSWRQRAETPLRFLLAP